MIIAKFFLKIYEFLKYVIIFSMKILFITDLYPVKPGESTTPKTLHNFVYEWNKQGHEVTVIKPNFILNSFLRGKPFYFTGRYEYEGIKIFNVNYFTPFCFNIFEKIPDDIKYNNYDVIIGHMPSGIIVANKIARTIRKPLICGVHCSDLEVLTNPIYEFYFKKHLEDAYKRAKKIACRSFVIQKKFNEILPEFANKTFVASSGLKNFKFQSGQSQLFNTSRSKLRVLTCANLIKRKNIDKLILAIRELPEFELFIIGDGQELENLKKIEAKNVFFLGRLSNDKVIQEMQKSTIFILPSINESFGMVYLEAMASGCITVCTKDDGIDGIINDLENGFLCEPNTENIKEILIKIKNHENLSKIIKNGIDTVREMTVEECGRNYLMKCGLL